MNEIEMGDPMQPEMPAAPDGPNPEINPPADPLVPVEEPPGTGGAPTSEPPAGPDDVDPPVEDPRLPGQPSRKQVD